MVVGKHKGNDFEREIAKTLSLWVSEGRDAFIYARRSGSGGAKRDKEGETGVGGDIFADKKEGEWLIEHTLFELKFYKDLRDDLWRFIVDTPSMFDGFIKQSREDSIIYGRENTLFVKMNRKECLVFTSSMIFPKVIKGEVVSFREKKLFLFPLRYLVESNPHKLKKLISNQTHKL